MLRIGQVEATATQDGKYTDGSVAGGIAATRLRAAAFNAMQEELAHIVESAGLALDINDMTQVLKAIQKLTLSRANPFADIKSDGAAAISTALTNLGLGGAAKLDVGTTAGTVAAGNDARFGLMIGVGQAWVNVTSSRASKTTYTNDTGKPILVVVSSYATAADANFIVDGVAVALIGLNASTTIVRPVSAIVPAGSTYSVSNTIGSNYMWSELR
ncbi:hypothetical protein [Escherichia coli]|uniref:hypothetical protein n=1 Tax=Escherichia coli TaxID=562 RepID=UPI00247FA19D|nr:hypothetical protein [Escherichia coli]WGT21135.1 hypothetical protein QC817_12765 [Escherichia coli]